ncbi:IS701 family transposase [Bradyrhizobium sp. C-145]|uniref:IS701 family transposase n=1 Tax=Bradyrhizobium sp. C-145 TaxID=574727 RepID=UPI00201B79BB|nr:IS701 family transposase [Bradyrhizobium sp. C-145]UQR61498.1 IS701 family transposase [Bradyrhizobium sp. C-145]
MAAAAGQFLDGRLGNELRKTGWIRAEAAGDPGPWRQQVILGRGQWDADALRDIVREYALKTLDDEDAVPAIDETGFLKQGKASCEAARQYTGSAGKITYCQIGVFGCYVSRHDHAFIDRALYLPKEWTDDPARLKAAHVPSDVGFATKPKIARQNDHSRDRRKGAVLVRGGGQRVWHRRDQNSAAQGGQGQRLCSGCCSQSCVPVLGQTAAGTAATIAQNLPNKAWRRLSSGGGTKGPPWHDWAYLELADLEDSEYNYELAGNERGVFWSAAISPTAAWPSFSTWCPKGTSIQKLVSVEGHRWAIETVSKLLRTSSALITTKPAPGMAGIAMSHSSCLPSPSGRHPSSGQHRPSLKKPRPRPRPKLRL